MFTSKHLETNTKRFFAMVIVVLFEKLIQQALKHGMKERVRDTREEKIIAMRLKHLFQE